MWQDFSPSSLRHGESSDLKSTMNRRVYRDHLELMHFIDPPVLIISQFVFKFQVLINSNNIFWIYVDVFENVHGRDKCVTERNEIIAYPEQITVWDIIKSGRSKVGKVKVRPRKGGSGCHQLDGPEADAPSESYYQELDVSETHCFLSWPFVGRRFIFMTFVHFHWKTTGFCYLGLLFSRERSIGIHQSEVILRWDNLTDRRLVIGQIIGHLIILYDHIIFRGHINWFLCENTLLTI